MLIDCHYLIPMVLDNLSNHMTHEPRHLEIQLLNRYNGMLVLICKN